jgi:hypothetical protein
MSGIVIVTWMYLRHKCTGLCHISMIISILLLYPGGYRCVRRTPELLLNWTWPAYRNCLLINGTDIDIHSYSLWSVLYCLPYSHTLMALHNKRFPSNESSLNMARICTKDALWSPTNRTRDRKLIGKKLMTRTCIQHAYITIGYAYNEDRELYAYLLWSKSSNFITYQVYTFIGTVLCKIM